MSDRPRPGSSTCPLGQKLDLQMLHDAQDCLRKRVGHETGSDKESDPFDRFYHAYDPLIRRFIVRCGVPREERADCLQDVWTEISKRLSAFKSEGTQARLCSWLHAIVHAKAVDLLRYKSSHPIKRLSSKAENTVISLHGSPAAEYEHLARLEAVQRVLAVLRLRVSELTFDAFYKHWVEGKEIKQIAAELTESQRKVSCCLYKGKKMFRLLCNQLVDKDLLADG